LARKRYSSLKALVHFTNVTELNARGEADVVHLDDPFFTIEARCEVSACGWDIKMHIYIALV
jgi:hypothetical protein